MSVLMNPSSSDVSWTDLASDCRAILSQRASVSFPFSSRSTPSRMVLVRSVHPLVFTRMWPGDLWEYVTVPVLDSFQGKRVPTLQVLELALRTQFESVDLQSLWDQ